MHIQSENKYSTKYNEGMEEECDNPAHDFCLAL